MRIDPHHPIPDEPQFLPCHGKFGFQLVDSSILDIAFLDQCFTASKHSDAHDADDIQHGIAKGAAILTGAIWEV